jgi:hypothetical protein
VKSPHGRAGAGLTRGRHERAGAGLTRGRRMNTRCGVQRGAIAPVRARIYHANVSYGLACVGVRRGASYARAARVDE